jgi:hypothetical protein
MLVDPVQAEYVRKLAFLRVKTSRVGVRACVVCVFGISILAVRVSQVVLCPLYRILAISCFSSSYWDKRVNFTLWMLQ